MLIQLTFTLSGYLDATILDNYLQELVDPEKTVLSCYAVIEDGPWAVSLLITAVGEEEAILTRIERHINYFSGDIAKTEKTFIGVEGWVEHVHGLLPPVQVGRFFIHGAHHDGQQKSWQKPLAIEAAQAFGTGHHATTVACIELLHQLKRRNRLIHNVFDLGTGTGVLAMVAHDLFQVPIVATDIDAIAVKTAGQNVRKNGYFPAVKVACHPGIPKSFQKRGKFDLITANILKQPLMKMAFSIAELLTPHGFLILSGFMEKDYTAIVSRYRQCGCVLIGCVRKDGWLALALERKMT